MSRGWSLVSGLSAGTDHWRAGVDLDLAEVDPCPGIATFASKTVSVRNGCPNTSTHLEGDGATADGRAQSESRHCSRENVGAGRRVVAVGDVAAAGV